MFELFLGRRPRERTSNSSVMLLSIEDGIPQGKVGENDGKDKKINGFTEM
jgi:hypothetical protein